MVGERIPQRPYLCRALHEWITDNGQTPHIVVDAGDERAIVPTEFVEDGRIVLNVGYAATKDLVIGNDQITFEARFGGNPFRVSLPVTSVLAIYARETGEGMMFSDADAVDESPEKAPGKATRDSGKSSDEGARQERSERNDGGAMRPDRSHLRVVK